MQRRAALLAFGALSLARPLRAEDTPLQPWRGPRVAPTIALNTLDGQPLSLASLRGSVVLVNFWATWCEPCVEEMPSMQRLRDHLASRYFDILAVNHQEGAPRIRTFLQKIPVAFPIVRDTDGAVARLWNVRMFPSSFVVDAEGHIRLHAMGGLDWGSTTVERQLQPLLTEAARRKRD